MRSTQELLDLEINNEWVIDSLLPIGGKLMLGGTPKAGKSYNMLKLAHCVLRESFFHGFRVRLNGSVLVLELDMPQSSHRRRIMNFHNITYDFSGMYHITKNDVPTGFNILKEPHFNWLAEQVRDLKPTLIVFDVLRSLFLGNENDSDLVAHVCQRIDDLLLEGNSSAVILHHTKKGQQQNELSTPMSPVEAVRGSSVIAGSMDTILALSDTGNSMQCQGRDVGNLTYYLKREFGGLPNRYIRKGISNRTQSIEKLLAGFIVQEPTVKNQYYYGWCREYVEDLCEEEFEQVRSIVSLNPEKYIWA